ncbi:MAG: SDR family NAD(P)-dependent oxidoreductase [Ruminococcaceae bacterium]|nr:SDR family NAD(P)-dependent oxidoreductase [Oscillospiraceae bacterium]
MSVAELVKMSNKYGSDPEFVLAGGGNTSYKTDKELYIKGSGTTLATIKEAGFVKMNREKLAKLWTTEYSADTAVRESEVLADLMAARFPEDMNKRPSVETLLHDLFAETYVLHVHPPMVNGLTCGQKGEAEMNRIFGNDAAWINETKPGYILALETKNVMEAHKAKTGKYPQIIFIQNHGIFFSANTMEELDAIVADVFAKLRANVKRTPDFSDVEFDMEKAVAIAPALRMMLMADDENATSIVTFRTNAEVMGLCKDKQSMAPVMSTYSPDHIVYCKHEPLFVEACDEIEAQYEALAKALDEYMARNGHAPKIVFVEGLGFYACGKTKKEADIAADVFMDEIKISVYAESFGGHRFMAEENIDFIRNWEVESYRQKVSLSGAAPKRLNEKIAIITGGAQGFGRGIAEEMAAQGCNVVIADLNEDGAKTTAKEIEQANTVGRAAAVKVDAGNEESVCAMVAKTVLLYGGLDIFVNNAGIVKAGTLDEMTAQAFDLVTKINYTAYFFGAKYSSKIMKIQHKIKNNYYSDIIQINSKSGLTGSNKNFAYAGSKFGGIGLTQSFALELAEYNIKVNSICPGNYLEGPLWMDPVKGLFVQYLNAGKVPGAKTVEDVKRFYEAKVPLNRGCLPIDVARALFYIVEQKYETGQAIPVTGGQEMLK